MAKSTYTGVQYTQPQIEQIWIKNGGDPAMAATMAAIAMAESEGWSGAFNPNDPNGGSTGLWQINGYGSTDPNVNAKQAMEKLRTQGLKAWGAYTDKRYLEYTDNPKGTNTPDGANNPTRSGIDQNRAAEQVMRLLNMGNKVKQADIEALFPELIVESGLDTEPWYKERGVVIGNPKARGMVEPVVFEVMMRPNNGFYMVDKWDNHQPAVGSKPVQIQLNASMKTFNINSKHNFHEQRTRTAWHITMWGLNADMIEGTCTTGVFMNQFGLTHLFSVAEVNDELKNLVTSGFIFKEIEEGVYAPKSADNVAVPLADITGSGTQTKDGSTTQMGIQRIGQSGSAPTVFDSFMKKQKIDDPVKALRVAAQDAFVELLSLFKMNGNVWFWTQDYNNNYSERTRLDISTFSPRLGISNAQMEARNNDVMTRGYVVMKFRRNSYLGYFKNLSWVMDANNPFQWTFNFTFQVERTISQLYLPR